MSQLIEISNDDDCFDRQNQPKENEETEISSSTEKTEGYYTSDEEIAIPKSDLRTKKSTAIKQLFLSTTKPVKTGKQEVHNPSDHSSSAFTPKPNLPVCQRMIGGVNIKLPVTPYGSQIALMYKIITAINKRQNCLLESPTGTGKTLALLCGALAWQSHERNLIGQAQAQQYFTHHPELQQVKGVSDYITSPSSTKLTPEKLFSKHIFGQKTIYDTPVKNYEISKRQDPLNDSDDSPTLVTIHKKRRINEREFGESSTAPEPPTTPEKCTDGPNPETPPNIRLPVIFYGARTHKQIKQVVKEFSRTSYCEEANMTILSSREYSCIREFDRNLWRNKNDMCKGCTETFEDLKTRQLRSNCEYFDNRQALRQKNLPPAFDLEDLVETGKSLKACPYYAARSMAASARIVFCPYNYLIEPGIRNSMQIDLKDNILIIDEAHNIEDICRDAATFVLTRDNILAAIDELQRVGNQRFAAHDINFYITHLIQVLRSWDDWFVNQTALVNNRPVNNNEAVHTWEVEHFVQTLNNHNIGEQHYKEFTQSAEVFCKRYRESPDSLKGITQVTGSLIEAMDTVLGYLFRESGRYKDDFKPVLVRNLQGVLEISETRGWRHSQFNEAIKKETLSLKLLCMNPAVIFEGLKQARCIILASGTLTPLVSLHSELATDFPLKISPNHVIPKDRVWIGSLRTCPNGQPLECNSRNTSQPEVQDGLGQAVLWVCQVTPHGVLCFLPSYMLMNNLKKRWQETGLWHKLNDLKHVFMESRNVRDHNDIMDDYYKYVSTRKGALLFAVYRGKVSEGMDFKDHQARAVITVGVPFPNTYDIAVKEKMNYNKKHSAQRQLLSSDEWLRVQAYRALNQAVGRCVRHCNDWGAVLLVDARFSNPYYTEHLSSWVRGFLGTNHHTFNSLVNSTDSLESFMQNMTIQDKENID